MYTFLVTYAATTSVNKISTFDATQCSLYLFIMYLGLTQQRKLFNKVYIQALRFTLIYIM